MTGNVREWCRDWYDDDYYKVSPKNNPRGPSTGSVRVLRGGSWFESAEYCRSAARIRYNQSYANSFNGLRLVLLPGQHG